MKIMKKTAALLTALMLCSCVSAEQVHDDGKLHVVCTSFALYDSTTEIMAGTDADIDYLLSSGADMHSYQPTADDIIKVTTCDMLVYAGGESDKWIEDALANGHTCGTVRLMDMTELALEEEHVEGMEEHDHHHDDDDHDDDDHDHDDHDHDDHEEEEYDEHIWLSPVRAKSYCAAIADGLTKADPDNGSKYSANLEEYTARLDVLTDKAAGLAGGTFIVADRFPFLYLAKDCGLSYYAAFSGCSAESEASFETVTFLTDKANSLHAPALFIIDGSDGRLAKAIADGCTDRPGILTLDSMQCVTDKDISEGADYIAIMEKDIDILKEGMIYA